MKEPIRDRLSSLSRAEMLGLFAIVAVTLGGAGLWYMRSLPKPVEIRDTSRPAAAAASPSPTTIIVDVAGWVRKPGVYEFSEGDRVIDAVEQAGGPRRGATLTSLNLAAPLSDGQQILVPEPAPRGATEAEASGDAGADSGKVNINTADAAELETLSGVGEVLAQRIIDYREEHGPFKSVDDLVDVSGIGDATLEEIRGDATT